VERGIKLLPCLGLSLHTYIRLMVRFCIKLHISGSTSLTIINRHMWIHNYLDECCTLISKLGHCDLHFPFHWLWLHFAFSSIFITQAVWWFNFTGIILIYFQVFHKISSTSYGAAADARFDFFLKKVCVKTCSLFLNQILNYTVHRYIYNSYISNIFQSVIKLKFKKMHIKKFVFRAGIMKGLFVS